jgi:hypothetical protein
MSRESASTLHLFLFGISLCACFGLAQGRAATADQNAPSASPIVAATAGKGHVRFAVVGSARRMRLQVLDQGGSQVYDSDSRDGSLLDWKIDDSQGRPLPDGLYGCIITAEDLGGLLNHRRAVLWLEEGSVRFAQLALKKADAADGGDPQDSVAILAEDEPLPVMQAAHDGERGLLVSGRGGFSFRTGDFFAGKDVEKARLTADGKLGLGVEEPAAKLDVYGLIRTSEGIQFPDGTIQRTAAPLGVFMPASPMLSRVPGDAYTGGAERLGAYTVASGRLGFPVASKRVRTSGSLSRTFALEGETNTFYGSNAGNKTTAMWNSFFGSGAGFSNTAGEADSFFGFYSGYMNTTGNFNAFFGNYTGSSNTSGGGNAFFGSGAGSSNTTGNANNFFGFNAGFYNTTGGSNAFFGRQAGESNTKGGGNSFFGSLAGYSNTTGEFNAFAGFQAGGSNTSGNYNSFLGSISGFSNTIENNNTFLGALTFGATGITNATAVGYQANVTRSNSLVLGSIEGINGGTSDTNVGIGTTTPDRLLAVEGSQAVGRFTRFTDSGSTFAPAFLLERTRGTRAVPLDIVAGDHLGKVQFRGRAGGTMAEYGMFSFVASDTSQNGRFAFLDRDLTTERMSILNTGNVGIGTTTPAERLHVVGNVRISGTVLFGPPAEPIPDYVFEADYKRMSIEEVGEFVLREKHLPGVPSASEIKQSGLDLGTFQLKLLEKIEELTLYTVEAAKTIRQLQAENAYFEARLAEMEKRATQK